MLNINAMYVKCFTYLSSYYIEGQMSKGVSHFAHNKTGACNTRPKKQ